MTDTKYHVCRICRGADKDVVPIYGSFQHRYWQDCILTLERQRDELRKGLAAMRELLETAVDSWDHSEIEGASWRDVTLSREWRNAARRVLEGKDGDSHE